MASKIQKLKQWRDELASRVGKPAYYILTNKNLEDALSLNPKNPWELEKLSGWGPKKIEKYGEEILKIINFEEPLPLEKLSEKNYTLENNQFDGKEEHILSVAQYINFINLTVKQFGEIQVTGEINDLSGVARGLAFFDLKDSKDHESTMQCVVFRNNFQYLSHLLEDGLEVVVYGTPSIYPKNGNFKFMVTRIEPVGEGGYKKALEKLKNKLIQKGFFAEERKRELPVLIRKIGLVTSSNGAAIEDFKKNLNNFGFEVFLKNVYVEGDQAEISIISAIDFFNRQAQNLDVLVLIRGGGSWESLKAFNSERVVEAIISSKIPIITGIGHENDESFAGMSSDFDCSTPSIVATHISQTREQLLEKYFDSFTELQERTEDFLMAKERKILKYINALSIQVENVFNNFDRWVDIFNRNLEEKIALLNALIEKNFRLKKDLIIAVSSEIENKKNILELAKAKISILNPENILKKGFGIVYSKSGKVIDSIKKIKPGDKIKIKLKDGETEAKVVK